MVAARVLDLARFLQPLQRGLEGRHRLGRARRRLVPLQVCEDLRPVRWFRQTAKIFANLARDQPPRPPGTSGGRRRSSTSPPPTGRTRDRRRVERGGLKAQQFLDKEAFRRERIQLGLKADKF